MKIIASEDGIRLDKIFLSNGDYSRNQWVRWIEKGKVLVNGNPKKKNYLVKTGDVIEYHIEEKENVLLPEQGSLDIMYEDESIAIINKPRIPMYPTDHIHTGTLANRLIYHFSELSDLQGSVRPGIVHRLDRNTTGLLIIAKKNSAHEALNEMMLYHKIDRRYLALVQGNIYEAGKVDIPLGRDRKARWRMSGESNQLRSALTYYRPKKQYENTTLLEVKLVTGRTHQIRAHMEIIGHPILGDPVYHRGLESKFPNPKVQMLHCYYLGFKHPIHGNMLKFEVGPDQLMVKTLGRLEKKE